MYKIVLIIVSLISVNLFGLDSKDENFIRTIPIHEVNGDLMPGWEKQIIEQYSDEEGNSMPVIFRGAVKNWEAAVWTPEYFAERFGNEEIFVVSNNDDDEEDDLLITMQDHIKDITFNPKNSGYFLGALAHNITRSDYLELNDDDRKSINSSLIKNALFLGTQLDLKFQTDFPQAVKKAGRSYFVFIGSGYTVTPLHNHGSTFLAQIYGKKLATLVHPKNIKQCSCKFETNGFVTECAIDVSKPDFEQYPDIKEVEFHQTILEAGDVLYIPERWLHDIRGLSTSISIASGF